MANGAHYFLYGQFEPAQPGVLRESGFGVTFPNFIVDVQSDASGAYSEAIQFQCLERGGVRIFEGINFLSRSPTMAPAQLDAMFARAAAAGMAPYGATPEQMHLVPHRLPDAPPLENSWQRIWAISALRTARRGRKCAESCGRLPERTLPSPSSTLAKTAFASW